MANDDLRIDEKPQGDIVKMPKATKDSSALFVKEPKKFRRNLRLVSAKAKPVAAEPEAPNERDQIGEMGLARRFAEQHYQHARYCPKLGWLLWDGARWEVQGNETALINELGMQTVRALLDEARLERERNKSEVLAKFYASSTKLSRIEAMIKMARGSLLVKASALDRDPFLFNCANGTIDLRYGKLRAHNPDDLITKLAPVAYDKQAKAPRWTQFLNEVFNNQRELVGYVQRAIGYSLTADQREQIMWFAYGSGSNGKDVLLKMIMQVAGDYARPVRSELLVEKERANSNRSDMVALRGVRLAVVSETDDRHKLNESQVKWLTGGGKRLSRQLFKEQDDYEPTDHFWLMTNYKPIISGQDAAIWRRVSAIPFKVGFEKPGDDLVGSYDSKLPADTDLEAKLLMELPGILTWAVQGAVAWFNRGKPALREPSAIKRERAAYKREENTLADFIEERCEIGADYFATVAELTRDLTLWLKDRNQYPWTPRTVGDRFVEAGYRRGKKNNTRVILGLHLFNNNLISRQAHTDANDDTHPKLSRASGTKRPVKSKEI